MFYMSNGQINVPLVIRMAGGAGSQLGAQHSHSLESWYAHVPGLKVAAPATPYDAKGLLMTAFDDDNPVIFIEHTALYTKKGEVPEESYRIPFGKADVMREGTDVTLIGYGGSVWQCVRAAEKLAEESITADVLNLRTLNPLDTEGILASVRKTNRAIVVEDDWEFGGFGGEIAAIIQEHAFDDLDAPVMRCAGAEHSDAVQRQARAGRPAAGGRHHQAREGDGLAMISEVVMPQMGADMTEGTLVKWLKNEGDPVERGEIIAEIETDKANVEIEAFESGVFRKAIANEGDVIEVGGLIGVIAAADEDISKYENGAAPTVGAQPTPAATCAQEQPRRTRLPRRRASEAAMETGAGAEAASDRAARCTRQARRRGPKARAPTVRAAYASRRWRDASRKRTASMYARSGARARTAASSSATSRPR